MTIIVVSCVVVQIMERSEKEEGSQKGKKKKQRTTDNKQANEALRPSEGMVRCSGSGLSVIDNLACAPSRWTDGQLIKMFVRVSPDTLLLGVCPYFLALLVTCSHRAMLVQRGSGHQGPATCPSAAVISTKGRPSMKPCSTEAKLLEGEHRNEQR